MTMGKALSRHDQSAQFLLLVRRHTLDVLVFAGFLLVIGASLRWDWFGHYARLLVDGLIHTVAMLVASAGGGVPLAIALGYAQFGGRIYLSLPARLFCSVIRGTPLLIQLWLLYYGLGSLFPQYPWLRHSVLWPYLREAWPYGLLALTLSFAGYAGEIMRGAFAGVGRGQIEAAEAFGMSRSTTFWRILLPQATRQALPALVGETILLMKATPLVSTISVMDLFAVASRIRQETYLIYEPLLIVALVYVVITAVLTLLLHRLERRLPKRA